MVKLFSKYSLAIASITFITAVMPASQVYAVPITYDFTVNVTQGPLAGKSFNGTFSYNDATLKGTGFEELGVSQGLIVCMNYLGRNYSETDDTSYPAWPKLIFENGKIKQLDFWLESNKRKNWWNLPGWEVKLFQHATASSTVSNCQKPQEMF